MLSWVTEVVRGLAPSDLQPGMLFDLLSSGVSGAEITDLGMPPSKSIPSLTPTQGLVLMPGYRACLPLNFYPKVEALYYECS